MDPELLARARAGQESAGIELYAAHQPAVTRLCLALLGDISDAEEVAQDSFVYAFRNIGRYDPTRSAFRTWLCMIAVSRCRNKRRRRMFELLPLTTAALSQSATTREVEQALAARGLRLQLWQALQDLPGDLREAVALRYLGGLRFREIGEATGCNDKTAQSRVRLGVERLRRALSASGDALDWAALETSG
ncbi:MAG: RNA polymerase sigma factor [Anaerolineales bacterium]|nr:RNA polymerase sigma factor [Anaerolineales bacterium]